jgi:hypothetical protein
VKLLTRAQNRVTRATIGELSDATVMGREGAVRSIQAADVTMPIDQLEQIWSPMYLERLARTYWRFLSRVTLGIIRVHYSEDERAVVLLRRPFVLLRFAPPEYELSGQRGIVRWRIRDGLLVSKRNEGYLEIDVRKCPCEEPGMAKIHVEVEVANFYPAIATWFTRFVYTNTQSRIHVIVTHGFLRSLARLDLEESAVGRFAVPAAAGANGGSTTNGQGVHAPENQTVGDTPWKVVGALAAGIAIGAYAGYARWRGPDR